MLSSLYQHLTVPRSRWHQPGTALKMRGKGASLALAGWSCTWPGFEETSGDCREISALLGNFTQSWMSAACWCTFSSTSFSLPNKSMPCSTSTCLLASLLPSPIHAGTALPSQHQYRQPSGSCFVHNRAAFCRWRTGSIHLPSLQQQQRGSQSKGPSEEGFSGCEQTSYALGTRPVWQNSPEAPAATTGSDSTATASKMRQNLTVP